MTTEQAITLANQVKRPHQRRPLDKLQGSRTARAQELAKSYDLIGHNLSNLQKRLDQIAADVEFIKNFEPGQPPRRMHS